MKLLVTAFGGILGALATGERGRVDDEEVRGFAQLPCKDVGDLEPVMVGVESVQGEKFSFASAIASGATSTVVTNDAPPSAYASENPPV